MKDQIIRQTFIDLTDEVKGDPNFYNRFFKVAVVALESNLRPYLEGGYESLPLGIITQKGKQFIYRGVYMTYVEHYDMKWGMERGFISAIIVKKDSISCTICGKANMGWVCSSCAKLK